MTTPMEDYASAKRQIAAIEQAPEVAISLAIGEPTEEQLKAVHEKQAERALEKVVDYRPKTQAEFLEKLDVLIAGEKAEEAQSALRVAAKEAKRGDPVVGLCDRWLRTWRMWKEASRADPSGNFRSRDCIELESACSFLLEEITRTTPTSPQGIARMLDVFWAYDQRDFRLGTEAWEEEMKDPGTALVRHTRNCAAELAGLTDETDELGQSEDW